LLDSDVQNVPATRTLAYDQESPTISRMSTSLQKNRWRRLRMGDWRRFLWVNCFLLNWKRLNIFILCLNGWQTAQSYG